MRFFRKHDDQPGTSRFNVERRRDRDIAEMLGVVKGVLADGVVTGEEAESLRKWVAAHPDVVEVWPGSVLAERIERIFADGVVDDGERADLEHLLQGIVGGDAGMIGEESTATALPLDDPQPELRFEGSSFVLTGKFAMGPRKACEQLVATRGGRCGSNVTKSLDYLVVGTFGSRDWIQTSHGRKIEKAVTYRDNGCPLAIVSESHWAAALDE